MFVKVVVNIRSVIARVSVVRTAAAEQESGAENKHYLWTVDGAMIITVIPVLMTIKTSCAGPGHAGH